MLFFTVVLKRSYPEIITPFESVDSIIEQSLMFCTADLVDGIVGHLHDVELDVNDLALGKWNHLLGSPHKGRAHVHGDRLD